MIVHHYEPDSDRWIFRDGERVVAIWSGSALSSGAKQVRALFEELEHFAEQDEERCGAPWLEPIFTPLIFTPAFAARPWESEELARPARFRTYTIRCELAPGHAGGHLGRNLTRERVAFPAEARRYA